MPLLCVPVHSCFVLQLFICHQGWALLCWWMEIGLCLLFGECPQSLPSLLWDKAEMSSKCLSQEKTPLSHLGVGFLSRTENLTPVPLKKALNFVLFFKHRRTRVCEICEAAATACKAVINDIIGKNPHAEPARCTASASSWSISMLLIRKGENNGNSKGMGWSQTQGVHGPILLYPFSQSSAVSRLNLHDF